MDVSSRAAVAPASIPATGRPTTSIAILIAAAVGLGVAHLGTSTMPFQIGALMDGAGLSASRAGLFGFFEVASLSLTMLLIAPVINRFGPAGVAFAGVGLCALAHLAMYVAHPSFTVLCLLAGLAGAGYGLVFAASIAAVAAWPSADRIYAFGNGGALVIIVALMSLFPVISARFGGFGPFLGVAITLAALSPAMICFRRQPIRSTTVNLEVSFRGAGVIAVLVVWTSFSIGNGAVWSFAERIGHGLSIPPETLALVLSASTLSGIAGTALAGLLARRVKRAAALVVGLVGTGLASLLLAVSTGLFLYALAVLAYWIFFMFAYSTLLSIASDLDSTGRVGTAGGGCERMGFALGVPLGGLMADHLSLPAVGVVGFVSCVGLLPFALPPIASALARRPKQDC